jgi:hypothetical protein
MRTTSVRETVRRCRRRRRGRRPPTPPSAGAREDRETEQGNRVDVAVLRGFLKRALEDDAVADPVNELLFEYVVVGHLHSSVVAETLPSSIAEILGAATREDWQAVADELIAEAREVEGEV